MYVLLVTVEIAILIGLSAFLIDIPILIVLRKIMLYLEFNVTKGLIL